MMTVDFDIILLVALFLSHLMWISIVLYHPLIECFRPQFDDARLEPMEWSHQAS